VWREASPGTRWDELGGSVGKTERTEKTEKTER